MTLRTRRFWARAAIVVAILGVLGGITGWALMRFFPNRVDHCGGIVINYLRTLTAPKGTLVTDLNLDYSLKAVAGSSEPAPPPVRSDEAGADWPTYNRTLDGHRY